MSKCEILPRHTALEDVWLALDMLPRFRWRWERRDFNGGHPLIAKLAERVMDVDLQQVGPVSRPYLLCEPEWDEDVVMSPVGKSSQQNTPTPMASPYVIAAVGASGGGPQTHPMSSGVQASHAGNGVKKIKGGSAGVGGSTGGGSGGSTPSDNLVDVPEQLFYPFFPETQVSAMPPPVQNGGPGTGHHRDYSGLLAAAAAAQDSRYACHSAQDSYISEERDSSLGQHPPGMQMWVNAVG